MITISGKNGIRATILAHSISLSGQEMVTWEIEYPRLILAELNTHRQLSRNSYSSRAVPFVKMLDQLIGEPVRFGANQAGMQDKGGDYAAPVELMVDFPYDDHGVLSSKVPQQSTPKQAWAKAKEMMIVVAKAFSDAGYHKQVFNRLMEAWQMQKTVLSATEVDNFFWLRDDEAADPTIAELARVMREAKEGSIPETLRPGEWHLPYIDITRQGDDQQRHYSIMEVNGVQRFINAYDAIKISCARCAAVSYRNEGYGLAKSLQIYDDLVGGARKHASAFEHQSTPMNRAAALLDSEFFPHSWQDGISHMDRDGFYWSGNLKGFIQWRKLIPGECYHKPVQ